MTGYVFLYAWLVVLAQLAVVLVVRRPSTGKALTAQIVSFAALAPLVFLAIGQRGQVSWIVRDTWTEVLTIAGFVGGGRSPLAPPVIAACLILIVAVTAVSLRSRRVGSDERQMLLLSVIWLVLPGLCLVIVSLWSPTFSSRYITFSAAAFALLLGYSLSLLPDRMLTVTGAGLTVAAAALVFQPAGGSGGYDNWQGQYDSLAQLASTGDVVVTSPRSYEVVPRFAGLPLGTRLLRSPDGLPGSTYMPTGSASLDERPPTVWVIPRGRLWPQDPLFERLSSAGYTLAGEYPVDETRILLRYVISK